MYFTVQFQRNTLQTDISRLIQFKFNKFRLLRGPFIFHIFENFILEVFTFLLYWYLYLRHIGTSSSDKNSKMDLIDALGLFYS